MNDGKQSAMIALLPITNDWCKIDCPHLTLVYAGEIPDLKPSDFNEMAKDAASLATMCSPIYLKVKGVELFGENQDTDVFTLQPTPDLMAMRRVVEQWHASDFPFNPHVTIGPAGSADKIEFKPNALAFDRLMVGWGEDQIVFWLKR